MYGYILGIAIALIISTILTFVFGFEAKENTNNLQEGASTMIFAPLSGEIVKLENVPEPVFSTEAMGKGIAIEPENDTIYAPFDGVVETIFNTKHAIGLRSHEGVEMIIHIGLETVQLKGEHFDVFVEENQKISQGEPLIKFNESLSITHGQKLMELKYIKRGV